jgi:hypothetical protein
MTASWRPASPARWEKKRALSQRVHQRLVVIDVTLASRACSAINARKSMR